jgi:hypothetical protein
MLQNKEAKEALDGLLTGAMAELAARKDYGRDLIAKAWFLLISPSLRAFTNNRLIRGSDYACYALYLHMIIPILAILLDLGFLLWIAL